MSRLKRAFALIALSASLITATGSIDTASAAQNPSQIAAAINQAAGHDDTTSTRPSGSSISLPPDVKNVTPIEVGTTTVYPNVRSDVSYATRPTASGEQALIVIAGPNAPTKYTFQLNIPTDDHLQQGLSGSVIIADSRGQSVGIIDAPWAKDTNGQKVATSYRVDGNSVVQTVNHAGAAYPVVADPSTHLWWGGADIYLSRGDMTYFTEGVVQRLPGSSP